MSDRDEAFSEFVATSAAGLRRTAYLVCGDWHRADDALQDALYKLYLHWQRVQRAGDPQAYARRAVVNAAVDGTRRPWRRESVSAALPETALPDPTNGISDRDEVLTALSSVGARQRACLVLRFYEDLSVEQTAEILGCSIGTVKSQTSRGLDHLRQALRAGGPRTDTEVRR